MEHKLSITFLRLAAVLGGIAVAVGAFGAHGLKPHLTEYQLAIYEKGVNYQFYHALALGLVALLARHQPNMRWLRWSGWLFLVGVLCFSGSLYLLACRDLLAFPVGWAGPVTPLGGLCFLGGWIMLGLSVKVEKV